MIVIQNKFQLRTLADFNEHVYVETTGQVFRRDKTGWIEKLYFTSDDICRMMSIPKHQLYTVLDSISIKYKKSSSKSGYKFKLKDLRSIIAAVQIKKAA